MAYFFFIFFCKDLVAYYMTPTCKISFLENLGGWQMLWNKRNWEFGSSFCHYLRFAQLSQTDFTDFPDLVFVPGRCAQWLNFWNSLTPPQPISKTWTLLQEWLITFVFATCWILPISVPRLVNDQNFYVKWFDLQTSLLCWIVLAAIVCLKLVSFGQFYGGLDWVEFSVFYNKCTNVLKENLYLKCFK